MKLNELLAKATPRPLACGPSGSRMRNKYSQSFAVYELGKENVVAGVFSDVRGGLEVAKANAALLAHSANVIEELVEALRCAVTKWEIRNDIEWRRLNLPTPDQAPEWIIKATEALAKAEEVNL